MNYRHAFHAGNFADVLKHAVLSRIVAYLGRKETAFRFLDTHAGIGVYDLAGSEAARTGEWHDGIGRLHGAVLEPPLAAALADYLGVVAALNPDGVLRRYPGSPEVVRRLARPQDRLLLCELHPEDARTLAAAFARDRRVKAVAIDGWTALRAYLPPRERRGLVLIDPPFEEPGEFERLAQGLAAAHARWAGGVYALWYPVKDVRETDSFAAALGRGGIPRLLRVELLLRRPLDPARLNGCCLVLVNPPWRLDEELRLVLPLLAARLAQGPGAGARIDWLTPAG